MRLNPCLAVFLLFALCGCGGGGGATSTPTTTAQTISVGQGTVTYEGSTKPTVSVATSAKTFSYVVTGGTLTSFNYEPINDSSTLPLLVIADGNMYLMQGGTATQISTSSTGYAYHGEFTPTGQIIYVGHDLPTRTAQIFACYADGSGSRKLTNSTRINPFSSVRMSPNGLHILSDFGSQPNTLVEFNASGGGETVLANSGQQPFWAPDSSQICFEAPSLAIVTAAVGSSSTSQISPGGEYFDYSPAWSPDGKAIAYLVETSAQNSLYEVEVEGYDGSVLFGDALTAEALPSVTPSFSPDSKYLAFVQTDGTTPRLVYRAAWNAQNVAQLGSLNTGSSITSISYAPFNKAKNLISSSGVVPSATGFLLNETGNGLFGSFVAATASPASSTKITQLNAGSGGAPIYELSGTALTSLAYINGYNLPRQIITLPASTPSALVTINPATGQLTAVAPFSKRPTQSTASGSTTLSGEFLGVYDSKGKLCAPSGTRSLTIDCKTGALLKT